MVDAFMIVLMSAGDCQIRAIDDDSVGVGDDGGVDDGDGGVVGH